MNKSTVRLFGRLGNILFRLANAFSISEKQFFYINDINIDIANYLRLIKKYFHIKILPSNIYCNDNGDVQSEIFFNVKKIRNIFKFNNEDFQTINIKKIIKNLNFNTCLGIQVRRGDYVTLNNIWNFQDNIYYENSYKKYFKNSTNINNIFITSDDIKWCKNNIHINNCNIVYLDDYNLNIMEILYLMSNCQHHIVSSSTFGWWCCWINEKYDSINIFPSTWFRTSFNLTYEQKIIEQNIIPKRWIKYA